MLVNMSKTTDISHKEVGRSETVRFEKIHTEILPTSAIGSLAVAEEIAEIIRSKESSGQKAVLGLATGSSPIKVYAELIRMHKEEGLSFRNVITFNLDEYYGLEKDNPNSYWHFMHEHLFDHVDILPENINIPDGTVPLEQLEQYCADYDMKIKAYGGLDFQILGIGRTGHIGFNEPGSHKNSGTRLITLDYMTRSDAANAFFGLPNVPRRAITMGVGTIRKARRIVLIAWGSNKADIIARTIEGDVSSDVPATYLQGHHNTTVLVDEASSDKLTRVETPWLVGPCTWDQKMQLKAMVWLCNKVNKPILKLTDRDFNENGMSTLLAQEGSAYGLNIKMFNVLQHTITGWPGGKPNADDTKRPERATPDKKRILILSPHPDDDVISMGGTYRRLVDQGHDVNVAYMTSGNISVPDSEARKFAELAQEFYEYQTGERPDAKIYKDVIGALKEKKEGDMDPLSVRKIKGLIRRGETLGAARFIGLQDEKVHFLDLPFYETGKVQKAPMSNKDMDKLARLIEDIMPHQIYAAGDLADPHGTQKICLDILYATLARLKTQDYMKDCWVWLYRGAWHDWPVEEIEMAVPLSPDELELKRKAIFYHQSQKDQVMFLGDDIREFWQRAEDRNRATASSYHSLGLAEYEAMEAFKRYHFL